MIPVFEKTSGSTPPEGTHFVRARNGTFLRNKQWWVDATVSVESKRAPRIEPKVPWRDLVREQAGAKLLLPPLPPHILGKALKLSKRVCDMSESEVCALVFHSERDGYQLYVPQQRVSPEGIDYMPYGSMGEERYVGSIHSHGLIPAYHSNIDEHDEFAGNDGVHVTIGSLEAYPRFSLSAEIAINRHRFPIEPSWFIGLQYGGETHALEWSELNTWQVPEECLKEVVQTPLIRTPGEKL